MKTLVILTAIFIVLATAVTKVPVMRPATPRVPQMLLDGKSKRRIRREVERKGF